VIVMPDMAMPDAPVPSQLCALPLELPPLDQLEEAARLVERCVLDDFAGLDATSVGRCAAPAQMQALLQEPLPEEGRGFAAVLEEFRAKVAPYALRPHHPRFLAFIPTAPSWVAILADWLSAGMNYFAGVWLEAAGPTQVELQVLDWFKAILGYPAAAQGILTGGGSEANLTALVVARNRLTWPERGRAVLYVSAERHWSVDRAAMVIGLHPEQVRVVAADVEGRFEVAALAEAIAADRRDGRIPWAVVASAGTTNTGAVDPLDALAALCREQRLWLHVDAAYGWPAALVAEGRRLLRGIDRADSITLDPHKWFAQTFEAGCLLVREGALLPETFALRPDYLQDVTAGGEVNFADRGIALTRRFRALKIWFSIKVLGLDWFRRLVERCLDLADYAEARLQRLPEFEIVSPRRLSIVAFRLKPPAPAAQAAALDELNLRLVQQLRDSGAGFISTTRLGGRVALRLCFINWRTTAGDVDMVIDKLQSLARSEVGCGL
jgi:aromatic-L-amino-acid decarboxylase